MKKLIARSQLRGHIILSCPLLGVPMAERLLRPVFNQTRPLLLLTTRPISLLLVGTNPSPYGAKRFLLLSGLTNSHPLGATHK